MSAGWDGYYSRGGSSIARHEWKGLFKQGGLTVRNALEDFVERRETERRERRTPAED
jgi:DDB1- and CUL4-associated factor 11